MPDPKREKVDRVARDVLARHIGERIAEARKQAGFSSEDLAAQIGASRSAVSMWENGRGLPDLLYLTRLVQKLPSLSFDELVMGEDQAMTHWLAKFSTDTVEFGEGVYTGSPRVTRPERADETAELAPSERDRLLALEGELKRIRKMLDDLKKPSDQRRSTKRAPRTA